MGFKNKSALSLSVAPVAVPAEGYRVGAVKNGRVTVTVFGSAITPQKAGALAKSAAGAPVKFFGKMVAQEFTPVRETRVYDVVS
jgi:hypothetical protein